jgi:hypothetical protein
VTNNNISCNPRNNDIGWMAGQITLIWNELSRTLLMTMKKKKRSNKEEEEMEEGNGNAMET